MLSRPASRVAHATNPLAVSASALRSSASTPLSIPSRPQHRRSSSKTSHPPGSPPPARGSAQTGSSASSSSSAREKRRARSYTANDAQRADTFDSAASDVSRDGAFIRSDAFSNVPRVEPTDHLDLINVKLSSLFALHRPIPINPHVAYPPPTTNKSFNDIFSAPKKSKISDEVYTLAPQSTQQSAYRNEEADGLHFSVLQSSDSNAAASDNVFALNPSTSLESIARQYQPFQKPPAPIPLGDSSQPADQDARPLPETQAQRVLKKRAENAEIANFFTAELPRRLKPARSSSQSFLSRMEERGVANIHALQIRESHINDALRENEEDSAEMAELENAMLLISVKRQRRLKMKKHKYKKLMRRTRNLRRREGRL